MATMSLISDSGSIVARSTAGNSFSIEMSGGVVALGMRELVDAVSTSVELDVAYGTLYRYTQPLTSLTITNTCDNPYESAVIFTVGVDFVLSMPEAIKTVGVVPAFIEGYTYIAAFRDDMVVFAEVK